MNNFCDKSLQNLLFLYVGLSISANSHYNEFFEAEWNLESSLILHWKRQQLLNYHIH